MGTALLALGASVTWGIGDFLGGVKARALPVLTVLAVSQPFGLVALGVIVAARGTPIPGPEVAWAALAAALGTIGLVAFFRGMAAGAITVIAPLAALAAGFPVIWGVVISGDRIDTLQAVGFVAALGGAVLASIERHPERTKLAAGIGWALVAVVCFGGYYVPMHAASTEDWLWPAFLFRCTSVTLIWLAVLALRRPPHRLRGHWAGLVGVGLFDTAGNAFFAGASSRGLLSVVSVLASLYPVVTVLLARNVLGERVQRTQDVGVILTLAGVVLITTGG